MIDDSRICNSDSLNKICGITQQYNNSSILRKSKTAACGVLSLTILLYSSIVVQRLE